MLGFSLSKMNLLILVTALFIIFSFFVSTMSNLIVSSAAKQELTKYVSKIAVATNSDNMCYITTIYIASPIKYLTQSLYFQLLLKKQDLENNMSKLTIALTKRKGREIEVICTQSLTFDGAIKFYSWNPKREEEIEEVEELFLDPRKPFGMQLISANQLLIIKEQRNGKNYLHLIPCSSRIEGSCERNIAKVKEVIKKETGEEYLPCFKVDYYD